LKMNIPPYLRRESSKVDEIMVGDAENASMEIVSTRGLRKPDKHKSEINIKRANIIFKNY